MYDIKTAADIQEALKDLLGGTIQDMPEEAELDQQMEAWEEAEPEYTDIRYGYKPKTLRSSMGEIPIQNLDYRPLPATRRTSSGTRSARTWRTRGWTSRACSI